MEAVKNLGSKLANIILPLAAFLPLRVERNQGQMPSLPATYFRRPAGLVGRAWLCTLKLEARRRERLGTQIMALFNLVVHLHLCWHLGGVSGFPPCPARPHLFPPQPRSESS